MFQAATLINREKLLMLLFVLFSGLATPSPPFARKDNASPSRSLLQPGGLMEKSDASLQRGG
jgi:hypothetical protein